MAYGHGSFWVCPKKKLDKLRFSVKCWFKGIHDGVSPDDMPFLTLYLERMVLKDLGYNSDIGELDSETATCLIAIKAEITTQENEIRNKSLKKGGKKRGR